MNIRILSIAAVITVGLYACGNKEASNEVTEETTTETTEVAAIASYTIDIASSKVAWKGTMLGVYSHEGVVSLTEGTLSTEGGAITGGSFTIDATSIVTTDDDALYAMAPREKLVGHLKADDFLGAEANPTGSFTITSASENTVTGNLTLKGVTNEEVITDVVLTEADGNVTATGALTFDRKKYGMAYVQDGDMVLSDDIELTFSLSGKAN